MAQDKYSQNRQLAYDLLKQEGYTDIGDSAEELFKNRANAELAYKLLTDAGYTDLGADYNEFSSMLYAPERASAATPQPSRSTKVTEQVGQVARTVDPQAVAEGHAMFNNYRDSRKATSSIADAPQATQQYMEQNPVKGGSRQREQLMEQLGATADDQSFIQEYDRRYAKYQQDTDNDLTGPEQQADKAWLDENNQRYREAKNKLGEIQGRINLMDKPQDIERIQSKKKENNSRVQRATNNAISMGPGGFAAYPEDITKMPEDANYLAANEILSMAQQTLNQGSKYAPGYEGNALEQVWTAAQQFVGGAINNIDMGSLTFGASEGAALIAARRTGDKSNEIVNATLKDMGYTDADANKLLQSVDEDGKKLASLGEELKKESAELSTYKAALDDMQKSGASEGRIRPYAREYNKRINAYNKRVTSELEPLMASYEKSANEYETLMSAIDSAVEGGLTDGEKALLDALGEFTDAKMKRAEDVSIASAAGAGAEQSAEFILDFILTGGLSRAGTKVATKLTARRVMKKFGAEAAAKIVRPSLGAQIATDAVVAGARTAAMFPRNLAAYGEQLTQMTGKDNLGRYNFDRSHLNAALNTALTQYIEYWSEGFGEYFGAGEQALFRKVTKAAPRTAIGKTLGQYRGSIGKYLDYGKFDGMFNEMLEEVVGSSFNSLAGWMSGDRVGDQDALKDFFSGEQLATLTLSFLPMSAISASTNIRAYNKMKKRYNESVAVLNPFLNSGAISREELEGLVSNIAEKTPEEIKDQIVEITDKARAANGGFLPQNFTQSLMGYVEGSFAMSMNNEQWEDSQEKMGVVNAYTEQYSNPDERNAYDLAQLESEARAAAMQAGFDENMLDLDSYSIARHAQALQQNDPQQAQVLLGYAVAKSANQGLKDGYDEETTEYAKRMSESIEQKCDINGNIIRATLADGTLVFITSKDASIGADGKLTTPTGADGLVTYISPDGRELQAKASTFTGVTSQDTTLYLIESEDAFKQSRDLMFEQAKNTISPAGKARALNANIGNTVFFRMNGIYEPMQVDRLTQDNTNVVVSGDPKFLNGLATMLGLQSPGGQSMELPIETIWPMLATNDDGSLATNQPEVRPAPTSAQPAATPSQPASEPEVVNPILIPEAHLGEDVEVVLDGNRRTVTILDVSDGKVYYEFEDENGETQTRYLPYDDFMNAQDAAANPRTTETSATPAEQPQAPTAEETPAEEAPQSKIPVDKDGNKIYDAPGVEPIDAYDDMYSTPGLTEEDVDEWVIAQSDEAEKNRNPKIKKGQSLADWGAAKAEANRVADFWKQFRDIAEERAKEREEARKQEAERQKEIEKYGVDTRNFDLTPQTVEEAVADYLGNNEGIIDLDDAKKEVFGKSGRIPSELFRHVGNGGILTKKGGRTIADVANDIVGEYEGQLPIEQDAVRDLIIDYLARYTKSEMRDMIFNNRLNAALAELEQQNGASEEVETAEEDVDDMPPAEEEYGPVIRTYETKKGTVEVRTKVSEKDGVRTTKVVSIRNGEEIGARDTMPMPEGYRITDATNAEGGLDVVGVRELREAEDGRVAATVLARLEDGTLAELNVALERADSIPAEEAVEEAPEGTAVPEVEEPVAEPAEPEPATAEEETPENNAPESSETPENSVPSQEEETPAEPEGPQMLTEQEIRNSGFADEDVIDAAVDYINGNHGFAETLAYNQIEEYVRTQRRTTEQTGSNADQTQLDGPVVQTGGVAAEQSGSQPGELGGNQETGTSERIPGPENGGVSAGVRGAANAQGAGLSSDAGNTGSERRGGSNRAGQSGRSSDDRGAGSQSAPVAGQPGEQGTATQAGSAGLGDAGRERREQGNVGRGVPGDAGQNGQVNSQEQGGVGSLVEGSRTEAGSTDIDALGGELEDLLKQFSNTTPSIDRDINGLDSVSHSVDTSGDEEGRLSRKQPKRPTAPLSLEGMTPQQMQLAGKILFSAAKLGYAFAKTEGLTTYNDFHRWFTGKFGDAVMKGLNYNETSLDAFIREVWNTKMKINGERLTLEQHAQELHNEELRKQSKKTPAERTRLQKEANEKKVPFIAANRKNIAEALPQLIPGQWDDVVAIERQFFDPSHNDYDHAYGKGMLITNGTGTGKTFTGLGVIKRFLDQGKGRILLVAPASMTGEWAEKAKLMGITATKLANTKDKGEGVVVTSYENFRENRALYEDDFDLVVYDECQNIIENQKGEDTLAFEAHKRITNKNVQEAMDRLVANTQPGRRKYELEQENDRLETERKKRSTRESRINEIVIRQREIEQEIQDLDRQIALLKPSFQQKAEEAVKKTKVLMLSATPFNTVQNLKFAEGYIFQYPKVFKSDGTEVLDEASRQSAFVTEWFRGDEPMEDMEIAFGDHLLDELETASYRELENGFDHSRDFPDVSGNVMASRFNAAWQAIQKDPRFQELRDYTKFLTDPTWTTQLFETMKVSAIRERLKEHLDAGRKIVIFHDRVHETQTTERRPAVGPPFATVLEQALLASTQGKQTPVAAIAEFRQRFADVLAWEQTLDYRPVHEQIVDLYATDADRATLAREMEEYNRRMQQWQQDVQEFERRNPQMTPEELYEKMPKAPKRPQLKAESVAVYNGEKTDAEKDAAKAAFNDDNSKVKIICVTTRSGGAGLSLHDTTGKHPRVMIQTALPVSPIGFIQAEGRIFRWGNQSNAVFEYPRLGIDLEAYVFAMQFNAKAETVENLAHGFRGRGLKDSIMTGFWENSGNVPIDGQGIGGVEMDKRGNTLKGMAKAKHDYGVVQRKGVKEGDTSIPEPVGFKMAEWAKAQAGDSALIPFAGRGSIARYVPKGVSTSALEDNVSLQSDLMVTSGGADFKIREGNFTELNMINKADVVLLNGATDQGGLDQIDTFKKGFGHLSEGGRLIAIVPDNAAANNAIAEITGNLGGALRATIKVRNEALDRGEGTSRIVVLDKISSPQLRATAGQPVTVDLTNSTKEQVFDLLENVNIPDRIIDKEAIAIKKLNALGTEFRKNRFVEDFKVTQYGRNQYITINYRRKPNGFNTAKRALDVIGKTGYYDRGSGRQYKLSDFDNPSQYHQYIKAYQVISEVLQMDDAEFRKFAMIENSAKAEDVDALRELYRLYQKMIRAAFGLTDSQIRRVLQGMRPDVSASDIETLNSYEELRAKFEAANHDDQERQDLYDKIAPIGEQLGLTIGAEAMDRDFLGGYNNVDNSLKVNKLRWNTLSDDKRATTLLHEFIHSVTVYALAAYNSNASGVSDALFTAAKLASDVFDQVQRGAAQDVRPFTGFYAIENEKEIMAEMANPEFREKLKNRRMWVQRSPRGIRVSGAEMEGAELTNAWALLNEALDGMLKNFDKSLFDRFRGRVNDFFWEVDREGKPTREADNGRADEEQNDVALAPEREDANYTDEEVNADNLLFREETDEDVLERLNSEPTIKVYRAMQLIDGNLYPPMSAKVDGKMREPIAIGKWERAEERPELADSNGNFVLNKGNGSSLKAKYNPYIHTSRTPLNDQFTSAYNRPNLVTVEVEVPESELTSGYKAEKAKDAVGEMTWHSGPVSGKLPEGKKRKVILSRWDKPVRVLPDSEVADRIAELLDGENIAIPYNVVTPGLRAELAQRGVAISDSPSGTVRDNTLRSREGSTVERRVSNAELEATSATIDRMSEEMGIKINRVGRSQMPRGHKSDKGYYNPSTGEMTICMDNVTDERDAIATVLHETVGHHGLRRLFGDRFNDAMARIYAVLDQKGKTWVNGYIARHPNADNTRAVEEYLSHLAESGNFKNTVWDNIKRIIGRIVDALFGTNGFLLTDNELNYILRASYENLKNPNWLNTVEGRAFDTLLKRQLGINETDPNKPTDPQGPDAGNLYRDGDTGVANDDYNREMERNWNKALTENQDADRPVRIGMDKVMKEKGIKSISEDEDYVTRHNLASSRAESEAHEFELFRFTPLMDQVRAIQSRLLGKKATSADREQAYERILDYMYAVSGLERNASKNAEIEQAKQAKLADAAAAGITDPAKLAEIEKKYEDMKRDWSGLTSLMGMSKDNWQAAETAARGMISAFERTVGDKAALDELWNRVRACTDFSLEHAYQHGLLTREEFERLHGTASQPRMWDFYLPLRGFSETTTEELFNYETFTNPSRGNVVVKKMNGRWTKADNPLANILNIAETEIVQGNDNWAKQALYRFTLNAGDNTLLSASEPWYVKNPATGKWSLSFPDPGESLEEFEARMKALRALDDPLAKKGRRGLKLDNIMANKAHRNEHAIHLKVGGIDKMIWVNGNPALAKAVSGIGRAQNLQWLRRASRALSNLFTTYSLDFTAKNLIRDTVYSNIALISKEDKAYRHQFHKNWIANFGYGAFAFPMVRLAAEWDSGKLQQKEKAGTLTKREQDFLNFMRDGGQTGYTIINSVNQIKRDLEKQMRSAGGRPGTVPILGWYAKAVKTLNEGFELLTRFTAYQTSRDMGRSGQRAASDAKEISVNFNRRGAQSGSGVWGNIAAYLGATHYFYNAGVQGFDNFLGLFKKKPVKMSAITAGFVMMGVLTPLINGMLAGLIGGGDGDDDWYWNLPEWVRRNNLVIGTGKWYVALPLPVEFRAPYGIGDIAGAAFAYDKYPNRHFGNVAGDIITTASGILPVNPIEGYTGNGNLGDAALRAVAPDAGMFFVDWATNRDYTGRPLWKENPFSDTVPKSQGAYASTPKGIVAACQKLAEVSNGAIDIAPGVVRDFMNNYGGGFFRAAEDVSKLLFTDEERPRRWDNVPFFSGFTGHIDEDRSNSFAQGALYDYKKLSEDNVKSMNAILNTDDVTSAVLYDEPESLYEREGVTVLQKAKIKRMLDSKDYALGKMYREGMNNKYKMKQRMTGAKAGQWYKSREVERKGVNALRQEWKDLRDQWAKMPDKTEEQKSAKAEMDLKVQEAWHLYYDAMGDLAEKLMDYEYNK